MTIIIKDKVIALDLGMSPGYFDLIDFKLKREYISFIMPVDYFPKIFNYEPTSKIFLN